MVLPIAKFLLWNSKRCTKSTSIPSRLLNSSAEHLLFNSKSNKLICDSPAKAGSVEDTLRCKLATLYKLVELHAWDSDVLNHITLRLPPHEDVILINAFGLLYDEVTSSNLLKVKLDGSIVDQGISNFGVNLAGMVLHSALHEARPDVNCILHFHQRHVQAVRNPFNTEIPKLSYNPWNYLSVFNIENFCFCPFVDEKTIFEQKVDLYPTGNDRTTRQSNPKN